AGKLTLDNMRDWYLGGAFCGVAGVTTAKGKGGYTTYKSVNGGAKQVVDTSVYPTAKKTTTTKKKKTR
ncbi:MAG: hypothetical protein J6332_04655, partial [Abditibacteriota bacterium]|nr:hypothetical protein [Abditibacteriota bacterium]